MAKRDPHEVLGVGRDATATEIKAAWRRLARAHHPDLTGDDPALSRIATRQMAEINDAYAALTRDAAGRSAADRQGDAATFDEAAGPKRGGPPRPKPTRPVTGRVDTSATYQARNSAARHGAPRTTLPGQPPPRPETVGGEPPRASTPTGPMEKDRLRHFRRRPPPSIEEANVYPIEFGKFHGHTLGQVAGFEPSYIDWLSGTVTRDPELVAAARVVQADLDRRGIRRRARPPTDRERAERAGRSA